MSEGTILQAGGMMRAHEVMNTLVAQVQPSTSVRVAASLMRDEGVGIVVICDAEKRALGILTDRDIALRVCAKSRSSDGTQAQEVMTPAPITCGTETELSDVESAMKQARIGRILVVDDEDRVVGVITLAELWHYESPMKTGPLSRSLTERELRAQSSGSSTPLSGAKPYLFSSSTEMRKK